MMMYKIVRFVSGTPQFRINESFDERAPVYLVYSQVNLSEDLTGIRSDGNDNKMIRTWDEVNTLVASDVLFSLISGEASIVREEHEGYLYTQNYVKLVPGEDIDPQYLVYLLNESKAVRKQFARGMQGSQVLKYTVKQVKELEIPACPSLDRQKIIGDIYFKQLRLAAIKERAIKFEKAITFQKLEEAT